MKLCLNVYQRKIKIATGKRERLAKKEKGENNTREKRCKLSLFFFLNQSSGGIVVRDEHAPFYSCTKMHNRSVGTCDVSSILFHRYSL